MTPSKNRSLGSPEFQISKFFDFGHFEPDITDFVQNLWRELTHSKIWILGSEHVLGLGHSRASMSKRGLSTSKFWIFFWILGVSSQISSILSRIYKGKQHLPKIGFQDPQNSRFPSFSMFGILSQISLILWRIYEGKWPLPNLDFQVCVRLEHGHSRASISKHRLSTSKHEPARANCGIFRFWAFRARHHRFCE